MIVKLQFDDVTPQSQNVPGLHDTRKDVIDDCVKDFFFLIETYVHISDVQ